MKKTIQTIFIVACAFILLESFGNKGLGKVDGTEPGYTGSPGDTLKNCTICHGGTAVNVQGWITSNIPATGYVPGNTYKIRAVNTMIGHNRFGFSISPQGMVDGGLLGTMVITDTTRTKLVGNNKYITYRAAGVQSLDSNVWEFDWIAPGGAIKEVIFYGAFNSNIDGHKGQDVTRLSNLRVWKEGFVGAEEKSIWAKSTVFPNPAQQQVTVQIPQSVSVQTEITLVDINGKQVMRQTLDAGKMQQQLDISGVPQGLYFVHLHSTLGDFTQKVLILP